MFAKALPLLFNPHILRCVLAELKSLGESYSESLKAARNLFTARCDHEKRKSAVACIVEIIGEDNPEHFFVATQDADLRKNLQEVPGVPVIFGLRNALMLEPPSAFQHQFAKSTEEERSHMTEFEYKMLRMKKKNMLAMEEARESSGVNGSEGDLGTLAVMNANSGRKGKEVKDKVQFKRKKAKKPCLGNRVTLMLCLVGGFEEGFGKGKGKAREYATPHILFLGGQSFEIEEVAVDQRGCRRLAIVERGQGLWREVVLVGYKVRWIVSKLKEALCHPERPSFLGLLEGLRQSGAVWSRGEEGSGSLFQIVVTSKGKRTQVFLPQSDFEDGWECVALVLKGFTKGDGWES
ncbi:hypothetical protein TEA_003209 [Camellia sinensis var. sinensis]|uniref:PIN domain-containing protein n=1 Tax=Camellia sinensis var. sinensis TaxID=542762 RepID=A0A4S4ETH1_CAMSN|nr:hypothetical protein TEA_003209 [Camellia sinensis var. sinensis]